MAVDLTLIHGHDHEDIHYVLDELKGYNQQFTSNLPYSKPENMTYILKDAGVVIAGLVGTLYWGCFHINALWVDESFRFQGHGGMLLEQAESFAKDKGCKFIHLDTLSFQAKEFYIKSGYRVFGELQGYPEAIVRYYMTKEL